MRASRPGRSAVTTSTRLRPLPSSGWKLTSEGMSKWRSRPRPTRRGSCAPGVRGSRNARQQRHSCLFASRPASERFSAAFGHHVGIERHRVVRGEYAGVEDGQSLAVKSGRARGEEVLAVRGVSEDLGTPSPLANQDEGRLVRRGLEDRARMPADLLRSVAEEVVLPEGAPKGERLPGPRRPRGGAAPLPGVAPGRSARAGPVDPPDRVAVRVGRRSRGRAAAHPSSRSTGWDWWR